MSTSDVALPDEHNPDVEHDETPDNDNTQEMAPVDPHEVRARQTGWVSKEEWEAQGKDPTEWISAARYNEKGEMIDTIKSLTGKVGKFDQRLANNNAIWAAKLEAEREALLSQRDMAIDDADKDKVKQLDGQIQKIDQTAAQLELDTQQNPAQNANPEDLQVENQFFSTLTRAQQSFAKDVAAPLLQSGLTGQSLVNAVQAEIDKEFKPSNPRRTTPSKTDSGRRGSADDALTMDSLSREDKMALQALKRTHPRYAKKSEKELLQMVKDSKL